MGIASPAAKALMSQPKPKSKTQIKKKEELLKNPTKYIACKTCHRTNVTLVRGTDSYYCKFCYEKQLKKQLKKNNRKKVK